MIKGTLYNRTLYFIGSPYSLVLYHGEFGRALPSDLAALYAKYDKEDTVDVDILLGILWAFNSSWDEQTPVFNQWRELLDTRKFKDIAETVNAFNLLITVVEHDLAVYKRPTDNTELLVSKSTNKKTSKQEEELAAIRKEWAEWDNILALLRLGFTLQDIRRMTMRDYITYTDLAVLDANAAQVTPGPQEADQAAIDRLFR